MGLLPCRSDERDGDRFGDSGPSLTIDSMQGFPTCKDFFTYHALLLRPLKMTGAAKLSKAYNVWDDTYFLTHHEGSDNVVNVETRKKENRAQPTIEISFQEFVNIYKDSNKYLVDPVPNFLRNEVLLPGPLQCPQIYNNYLVENIMWFSSGGTKSVVHTDAVDNIICLYSGEKTFVMVDPDKYSERVDIDHPEGAYSDIDVDNVDYDKYPGLLGVEFYHTNISAGDCLYIPYKWIHQVRSYDRNIAVNVWWDHHRNHEINLDNCPTSIDPELTLDKVSFVSFAELMSTVSSLRDQFYEFSARTKSMTFDRFVSLLTGNMDPDNADNGYTIPLKQIFKIIDVNHDGIAHRNEVLATSDEDWEEIQNHMSRFEAVMEAIDQRISEDEDDSPDDDFHDEL